MSALSVTPTATPAAHPASSGWVRQHTLLALCGIMFVLAWAVLVQQTLASRGLLPIQVPAVLGFAAGWSPAIAALVVTGLAEGRAGVRRLLSRFLVVRVGRRWYAVSLLLIAAAILGGIGLHVFTGGAMPVIPALRVRLTTALFAFVVTLVLGCLFNTEEMAWRGVALPQLQARHGALLAALLVAVPEALFHLPGHSISV